jgi:basic amino acid/polyamine antiporter, APA family
MQASSSEPAPTRAQLLPLLSVRFGLAVTIGTVVGAGLLRTPGIVAEQMQTFWPFIGVWIAGGLYVLLGANAIAELATLAGRSGGPYVFVRRGLGRYAGFVAGWSDWVAMCGATAAVAIILGEYTVAIFPAARAQHVVALSVVVLFTLVQWAGVRPAAAAQALATAVKVAALLAFVVVCFWLGSRMPAAPAALLADREGSLLIAFVLALHAVIFSYDGWAATAYFTEEMRDYPRNVPRALLLSAVAVVAIYVVVNLAILGVVSVPTIAGSGFAIGVVAERLFGPDGATLVRAGGILVLLSAVSATVLMAPRVLFAMSGDRLFWRGGREVSRRGTPDVALLISSMLAAAFIVSGTFESVIAKLAFFYVANYALSFISLFVLRSREPDAPRPWRAWGHPWTTAIALLASLSFLAAAVAADLRGTVHAVLILLLSVPVYLLLRHRERPAAG